VLAAGYTGCWLYWLLAMCWLLACCWLGGREHRTITPPLCTPAYELLACHLSARAEAAIPRIHAIFTP
jgi:hypothetical protein